MALKVKGEEEKTRPPETLTNADFKILYSKKKLLQLCSDWSVPLGSNFSKASPICRGQKKMVKNRFKSRFHEESRHSGSFTLRRKGERRKDRREIEKGDREKKGKARRKKNQKTKKTKAHLAIKKKRDADREKLDLYSVILPV